MGKIQSPEKIGILLFFTAIILLGALLLWQPFSWINHQSPRFIDALFTSVSAVCVTGLTVLPTSSMTPLGQIILLILIQLGGLGIITLTSVFLLLPGLKVSLGSRRAIRDFFLTQVEHKPRKIIRDIVLYTLLIELFGAVCLWILFLPADKSFFYSLFHAISAFCNAGFSLEDASLLPWTSNVPAIATVSLLIIAGGLGWVVLHNTAQKLTGKTRHLTFHATSVLLISLLLILLGAVVIFLLELLDSTVTRPWLYELGNSLFYSVSTRTAGFNIIPPSEMTPLSQLASLPLMIIGASPGSTGGGVKTTTFLLFLLFVRHGMNFKENVSLLRHRIAQDTLAQAGVLMVRYFLLFLGSALVLYGIETGQGKSLSLLQALYESASSLGTVGLSLDVSPRLSDMGKSLVIFNMFAGRVGLLALSFGWSQTQKRYAILKPKGEVMML